MWRDAKAGRCGGQWSRTVFPRCSGAERDCVVSRRLPTGALLAAISVRVCGCNRLRMPRWRSRRHCLSRRRSEDAQQYEQEHAHADEQGRHAGTGRDADERRLETAHVEHDHKRDDEQKGQHRVRSAGAASGRRGGRAASVACCNDYVVIESMGSPRRTHARLRVRNPADCHPN